MGRKPTGRPRGRQKGSGTLGLGSEDAHQRLTIRIPQALYNRLEAFAEGRHYTRGTAQLAGSVREAIEHFLSCPHKRQTLNRTSAPQDNTRQTVNGTHEAEDNIRQTVSSTPAEEDSIRQTVNVPVLVEDVEPVAISQQPAQPALDFDTSKYYLGKLCPRGHDYKGTGQSVLTLKGQRCRLCDAEKKREKRARAAADLRGRPLAG